MSRNRRKPTKREVRDAIITDLPDVSTWQPRSDVSESLVRSFRRRCSFAERRLKLRVAEERAANLDNYDSGVGVEEIFRDELQQLLPSRYSVLTGVLNDRMGRTAGHCDALVFNETWFPAIKAPAVATSRRPHLPIEGVYAAIEVKQSLSPLTLDQAMEKLVCCHRLHRPPTPRDRIVENRESGQCIHAISNPLYSAVFAVELGPRANFQKLVERFVAINKLLKRSEVIRTLIVLNHGVVNWGYCTPGKPGFGPAMFSHQDLYTDIFPVLWRSPGQEGALFNFIGDISKALNRSVLGAEDLALNYGYATRDAKTAQIGTENSHLPPDDEHIRYMTDPESLKHNHGLECGLNQ